MFKYTQQPPRGPEDLSFSKGGQHLLERTSSVAEVKLLGRAACVELADDLEDVTLLSISKLNSYGSYAVTAANRILDRKNLRAFVSGFNDTAQFYTESIEKAAA